MRKDCAVFILTYGRADNVITHKTLRKQGYTGKIYLVCSTDDKQLGRYKEIYGDDVIVFCKDDYKGKFDIGDNFQKDNVVVFARNAAFDLAKEKGLKYFIELDDDYTQIEIKHPEGEKLNMLITKNITDIFNMFVDFLKKTKTVTSIALAQGGDFIGGVDNDMFTKRYNPRKRKLMNCYFNAVERPYQFYGRINEDCNCYIENGKKGVVFLTHPGASIVQSATQTNPGGLTDFYLDGGTYTKSFYTILFNPSAVKVKMMGHNHRRLHHSVSWKNAVPVIMRERHKKAS